jgi:hypothetical protein
MDDSEKTYGYSEDIYHGKHGRDAEKSYEYGAESSGDSEGSELSPEEAAIHIEGPQTGEENVPGGDAGEYDYGRGSSYAAVESFTWNNSGDDSGNEPEKEAHASETGEREDERVGAPEIQNR